MKILRYLTIDILSHLLAVSFVLLAIIFSGRFVKYLAEAAIGDLAAEILLPVMLYRLPGFLELIVPLGLFIAILLSYGRLYVESEMVVLTACGVSPTRLAGYTLVPSTMTMVLVAVLSLVVTPLGAARSEALLDDPDSAQGVQNLAEGRFQVRSGSDLVSYAQTVSPDGKMHSVFLSERSERGDGKLRMRVTVAREGEIALDSVTGARYLELRDGYRYDGFPGDLDYEVVQFERFGELIPEPEGGIRTAAPVDGRPTLELLKSKRLEDIAALQWRLSLPLMVPIVAIIAMCLSRTNHRRGRYLMMAPALVIYLAYLLLLASARADLEAGTVSPRWGIVWVHLLFLALALALLYLPTQWRRLRYRTKSRASA